MSAAVFGGAGELHRFLAAVVAISAVIVVVAVPIRVPVTIPIGPTVISVAISAVIIVVAVPIRIPITIPIARTMISVMIRVFVVATETIMVAVAALSNLRSIHQKIRAASTINPNSLLIESPSLTLSTGRLAMLSL